MEHPDGRKKSFLGHKDRIIILTPKKKAFADEIVRQQLEDGKFVVSKAYRTVAPNLRPNSQYPPRLMRDHNIIEYITQQLTDTGTSNPEEVKQFINHRATKLSMGENETPAAVQVSAMALLAKINGLELNRTVSVNVRATSKEVEELLNL